MTQARPAARALIIAAIVAILFGALTVLSGGRALFGDAEARAAVGNAVPFVLWFNFMAGFASIAAGIALFLRRRAAVVLSLGILAATVLVFLAFGIHVMLGNAYEMRTVGAMILRICVWAVHSVVALRTVGRSAQP